MEYSWRSCVHMLRKNGKELLECGAHIAVGQAIARFALIGRLGFLFGVFDY